MTSLRARTPCPASVSPGPQPRAGGAKMAFRLIGLPRESKKAGEADPAEEALRWNVPWFVHHDPTEGRTARRWSSILAD